MDFFLIFRIQNYILDLLLICPNSFLFKEFEKLFKKIKFEYKPIYNRFSNYFNFTQNLIRLRTT